MPKLQKHDPLAIPATLDDIKVMRVKLESSPVEVYGHLVDCDDASMRRMYDAMIAWDTVAQDEIVWTMADDKEMSFNQDAFNTFVGGVQSAKGDRSGRLHASARRFKADKNVTKRMIAELNWYC